MKRTLSFIFLFTLFTLLFAGCSKPKSPSGDGGTTVTGSLQDDIKGKEDVFPKVKSFVVSNIQGYKDGSGQVWNKQLEANTQEYLDGIIPNDENYIQYDEIYVKEDNGAAGSYYNRKYCRVFYDKDSGKRLEQPICDFVFDNDIGDGLYTNIYDFTKEVVAYAFFGDSVETSKEYLMLPPTHKKA